MRDIDIEAWALQIIAAVQSGHGVEDDRVELKRELPDPQKAARRIAGHCNAARGASVMWIIGVDEKVGVVGFKLEDVASWLQSVQSQFDVPYPENRLITVHAADKAVLAIVFDGSRAPFLVRNPTGGTIAFEVPWREGVSTRTARRADLISMLSPPVSPPHIELLSADAYVVEKLGKTSASATYGAPVAGSEDPVWDWNILARFYISPINRERIVLPNHKMRLEFYSAGLVERTEARSVQLRPRTVPSGSRQSETIRSTLAELIIDGPGEVYLRAYHTTRRNYRVGEAPLLIRFHSIPVGASRGITVDIEIPPLQKLTRGVMQWETDQ